MKKLLPEGIRLIGLGQFAGVGKDTVGTYLEETHDFDVFAFADPLKDGAAIVFGLDRDRLSDAAYKAEIDPFWNETNRALLQKFGTECMRKGFRDDVWIKAMERRLRQYEEMHSTSKHHPRGVVITDVRFQNEMDAIRAWGGELWRVNRDVPPPPGGVVGHVSETPLPGWDREIDNVSGLAELKLCVDLVLGEPHVR